jgi:protein tyrosine phosphatase (PTP) superfamily phosphohydrolase (DUF442 family)
LISAETIYSDSLLLGYDYQNSSDVVSLINAITGRHDVPVDQKIELTLANGESSYKSYYWPHRLGESDNWYNIGQILSTHVDAIVDAGYKTVLCYRDNGESTARLPNETTTGAVSNAEFSDANGNYNVKDEQLSLESHGLQFIHLPLSSGSSTTWTKDTFYSYLPTLQSLEKNGNGPVLIHCASGYRSSAFTLTYLAYSSKKCSDWVFSHAKDVGFIYDETNHIEIISFMKDVLGC